MYLLSKSFYAKLLAVFRVSRNKGSKTPGSDNLLWKNGKDKLRAACNLKARGYKAKPLKRIYILKKNGKKRPLSIPTLHDRAVQALHRLTLDPVAESLADPNSYGFRWKRACCDAIQQCFKVLCHKYSAQWVFEADIKACFDCIDHDWILNNIPVNKRLLRQWLKAGFIENNRKYPTLRGTPQGGIISPLIMNMVLDGMEKEIRICFPKWKNTKVNFVRYADDFIVTAPSKEILTEQVIPLIKTFLKRRGLTISEEKSRITHINDGFDFLSQNIRKYKGKLLIKPSKSAIQSFKNKVKNTINNNHGIPAHALIRILNPIIRGWANYHKGICAKESFYKLETFIYHQLKRWAWSEHGNKNRRWIHRRYFLNNQFSDIRQNPKGAFVHRLFKISHVPIRYTIKIKNCANPFLPEFDNYFYMRKMFKLESTKLCRQKTTFKIKDLITTGLLPASSGLKSA